MLNPHQRAILSEILESIEARIDYNEVTVDWLHNLPDHDYTEFKKYLKEARNIFPEVVDTLSDHNSEIFLWEGIDQYELQSSLYEKAKELVLGIVENANANEDDYAHLFFQLKLMHIYLESTYVNYNAKKLYDVYRLRYEHFIFTRLAEDFPMSGSMHIKDFDVESETPEKEISAEMVSRMYSGLTSDQRYFFDNIKTEVIGPYGQSWRCDSKWRERVTVDIDKFTVRFKEYVQNKKKTLRHQSKKRSGPNKGYELLNTETSALYKEIDRLVKDSRIEIEHLLETLISPLVINGLLEEPSSTDKVMKPVLQKLEESEKNALKAYKSHLTNDEAILKELTKYYNKHYSRDEESSLGYNQWFLKVFALYKRVLELSATTEQKIEESLLKVKSHFNAKKKATKFYGKQDDIGISDVDNSSVTDMVSRALTINDTEELSVVPAQELANINAACSLETSDQFLLESNISSVVPLEKSTQLATLNNAEQVVQVDENDVPDNVTASYAQGSPSYMLYTFDKTKFRDHKSRSLDVQALETKKQPAPQHKDLQALQNDPTLVLSANRFLALFKHLGITVEHKKSGGSHAVLRYDMGDGKTIVGGINIPHNGAEPSTHCMRLLRSFLLRSGFLQSADARAERLLERSNKFSHHSL